MKLKDYWRLAKISLQARKKSTKATVRGMAFSLIIIVPLLFMMIGLNQGILDKLNKNPEQLYAIFSSAEKGNKVIKEALPYQEGVPSWNIESDGRGLAFADHSNYFENSEIETLHYSTHIKNLGMVPNNNEGNERRLLEKIEVDGVGHELIYKMPDEKHGYSPTEGTFLLSIVKDDLTKSNKMLSNYFVDGMDKGFTGTGAQQIIINEKYLECAGLKPEDVYGKKIGVYFRDSVFGTMYVDSEDGPSDPNDDNATQLNAISHHLFRDFEVVGVLKNSSFAMLDIRNSSLIATSDSYYKNGKCVLAPKRLLGDKNRGNDRFNYGDYKAKEDMSNRYIYPGGKMYGDKNLARKYTPGEEMNSSEEITEVENNSYLYMAKDYKDLERTLKEVAPEYAKITNNDINTFSSYMASEVYNSFLMINTIFSYAMLFGGIVAGVILFAALINLFNSIKHSVDSRRNYLGVMKAIGARDATIPKLYFFEVLRIFLRAYVRIFIVGTIICVGIMVAMHFAFKYMPFQFTVSWVNIPIVMGILAGILVVMGALYSLVCSYSMSKKPITELLEE